MPRVLRQAAVQNPQLSYSIVQVLIVLVTQRARLDSEGQFLRQQLRIMANNLLPLCYFVRSKIRTSEIIILSSPSVHCVQQQLQNLYSQAILSKV